RHRRSGRRARWRRGAFRSPSFADPPPPAVLGDRPVLLLDLQPPPRRPALVRAGLVLGDQALVAVADNLGPGVEAVAGQTPYRQHEVGAGDDVLQVDPPGGER